MARSLPPHPPAELFEQIGRLCAAWAYVEMEVERTIWGILRIDASVGNHLTPRLDMRGRWDLLASVARARLSTEEATELSAMKKKMPDLTDDRNLYVHGLISAKPPKWEVTSTVYRGKDSGKPKPLTVPGVIACREEVQKIGAELHAFSNARNYPTPRH